MGLNQSYARDCPKKIKVASKQPAGQGAPGQEQDAKLAHQLHLSFEIESESEVVGQCGLEGRGVNLTLEMTHINTF